MFNPESDLKSSAGDGRSRAFAFAFDYQGSFLDGKLSPIATARFNTDAYNQVGGVQVAQPNEAMDIGFGLGLKFKIPHIVEGDINYTWVTHEKQNSDGLGGDKKGSSWSIHARYAHEMYKPFIKVLIEEEDDNGSKKFDQLTYQVGFEWYPSGKSKANSRWHLVYTIKDKDNASSSDLSEKTLLLGFKFNVQAYKL